MFRCPVFAISLCLTLLLCISCESSKKKDQPPAYPTNYTRDEDLQQVRGGTTRDSKGKVVIGEKGRLLLHIRGSKEANYHALTGPRNHLGGHGPTAQISGNPTGYYPPGTTPPDVGTTSVPAGVLTDNTNGEAKVLSEHPFLMLINGWVYISGFAPAAQTEHVIAGSDSTKFIVEIYRGTATTPDGFIHRIYAVEGTVDTQALDNGPVGPVVSVASGRYIEVRYESGAWAIYGPALYPTGPGTFVQAVLDAAAAANVP